MRMLAEEKKIAVLKLILEGCSIRSTERITGVQRDTIIRLCVSTGNALAVLHDRTIRNLSPASIEFDELWSYVGKKQKNLPDNYEGEQGDQYLFLAIDSHTKLVVSSALGKRTRSYACYFLRDLKSRIQGNFQLCSDKFNPYRVAVQRIFGESVNYGQVQKNYNRRGKIVSVTPVPIFGTPSNISTTTVERNNLTLRMGLRRLSRKTNAFSKKLANHKAFIALYLGFYNFCKIHGSLGMTPAMAAGVTDEPWTVRDLLIFETEMTYRAAAS